MFPLGGFSSTVEPFGQHQDHIYPGKMHTRSPTGGLPLATLSNRLPIMSAHIMKASISLVAVATSAGSLFVISWIGLALLGF